MDFMKDYWARIASLVTFHVELVSERIMTNVYHAKEAQTEYQFQIQKNNVNA